jgi:ABC-type nitrate/sulfonate/bicarbonate transport system substrate-binding protein
MPDTSASGDGANSGAAGRKLGQFVRKARTSARPEAERLAHQARDLAETHLPQVRQTSQEALGRAGRFAQEHDDEFRQAGLQAARMLASRSVPLPLQPVVAAATDGLARRSATPAKPVDAPPAEEQPEAEEPARRENGPLIF